MYEQGTDSVTPSAKLNKVESATVELCNRRPSGLTVYKSKNKKVLEFFYSHYLEIMMTTGKKDRKQTMGENEC